MLRRSGLSLLRQHKNHSKSIEIINTKCLETLRHVVEIRDLNVLPKMVKTPKSIPSSGSAKLRFIQNLTADEKWNFFNSFDLVFCDCDGVIWQALHEAIPGAAEAITYLRSYGKRVAFVTNNSIIPAAEQLRKFQRFNIDVDKSDLIHPAQTVCDHLRSIAFEGPIFCLASRPFKKLLRDEGFQLVEEKDRLIAETVQDLHDMIYCQESARAVVIDVDFNLTAAKLMRAHVLLKNPECLFIGGAADSMIPFGDGLVIGSGPFIGVVEQSSKRRATILGKPGKDLSELLRHRFQLTDPRRVLFIGDSLTSDIKFGNMSGYQTLVVLTGATKIEDFNNDIPDDEKPDFVAESLGELSELI